MKITFFIKNISKSLVIVLQNPGFKASDTKVLIAENKSEKDSEKTKTKQIISPKKKKKK